jgi:hydrogenase-1 operon protein HyaE
MNAPPTPSAEHPLVAALPERHGIPRVDAAGLPDLVAAHPATVLFFAGNTMQHPESLDLAVILPELMKTLAERCVAALVDRTDEQAIAARYGVKVWPSLVFLAPAGYLGRIERLRDWSVYRDESARLLAAVPGRLPALSIPVVEERPASCH